MRNAFQTYLPGFEGLSVKEFGGSDLKGNPREARPISVKRPMHLVLRSSQAKGAKSFLAPHRSKRIEALARTIGLKTGVEVKNFANSGNHLHLIILPRSRKAFRAFIRAFSGVVARLTLGLERGRPRGKGKAGNAQEAAQEAANETEKFWDARPYTRILEWGRSLRAAQKYLARNFLEALRVIAYQPRTSSSSGMHSSRAHKTILARGRTRAQKRTDRMKQQIMAARIPPARESA